MNGSSLVACGDYFVRCTGVKGRNEPAMLVQARNVLVDFEALTGRLQVLEVIAAVHQVEPSVVAEHAWNNTTKVSSLLTSTRVHVYGEQMVG